MGFIIYQMELDIPERYAAKMSELVLNGEFSAYIADLIIKDLAESKANIPQLPNQMPAMTDFYQSKEYKDNVRALMREAFADVLADKAIVAGSFGVGTSIEGSSSPKPDNNDAIDVTPRDLEVAKVDLKASKGANSLLNKFGKMRKG